MRKDILDVLSSNGVSIELKGYKEMASTDGYHMRGTLYVNGKKAIFCEDLGIGGECDVTVLNPVNAKPLLDIKDELAELKAYPEEESIKDLPLGFDNIFYLLAEDYSEKKELKKYAKKYVLVKFINREYEKGAFTTYEVKLDKSFIKFLIKKLSEENLTEIIIWNIECEWKTYSIEDLKKLYEI